LPNSLFKKCAVGDFLRSLLKKKDNKMKTITLENSKHCPKCGWKYEDPFQRRVIQDDKGFYIGTSCECGIHTPTNETSRFLTLLDADKFLYNSNNAMYM